MADTTTNYALPTEDARYTSLEAMIKTAFEKIDAALKAISDAVEENGTAIADLDERVTDLEDAGTPG